MKPPVFDYQAPTSVDETLSLLAEHGYDGKVLAGGQSFVPILNMRLANPQLVVDINKLQELETITVNDNELVIGALVRQQTLLEDSRIADACPLLPEATQYLAHKTIRNRGTVGGSLAHSDPSAELPAAMMTLDAQLTVRSQSGERTIPASDFFVDIFTTDLQPEELLTRVTVPRMGPRTGWDFQEVSRRHGDYALVAVSALVELDEAGNCTDARLVITGVGSAPITGNVAERLRGTQLGADDIQEAVRSATANLDPLEDVHASATYRKHVAQTLSVRALTKAHERAGGRS